MRLSLTTGVGRNDVGKRLFAAVLPKRRAVLRRDGDDAGLHQGDVLANAADLGDDRRGVGAGVGEAGAAPQHVAGGLIEGDEQPLRAARRADQLVAVHQRRPREAPAALLRPEAAGRNLGAEFLRQVLAPDLAAVGRLDANQHALTAEGEHPIAVHGGRRIGAAAPLVAVEVPHRADVGLPAFLALVVQGDELLDALVADGVERPGAEDVGTAADHGEGAVAGAGVLECPGKFRAVLGPLLEEAGFRRDAAAVGAAPLRPVGGDASSGAGGATANASAGSPRSIRFPPFSRGIARTRRVLANSRA